MRKKYFSKLLLWESSQDNEDKASKRKPDLCLVALYVMLCRMPQPQLQSIKVFISATSSHSGLSSKVRTCTVDRKIFAVKNISLVPLTSKF